MKTDALLILSVPELGKVKTRLAKTIGNEKPWPSTTTFLHTMIETRAIKPINLFLRC
jgi:glycosyltransferase A (GT-A) superfamily protein (DUF2064 family)